MSDIEKDNVLSSEGREPVHQDSGNPKVDAAIEKPKDDMQYLLPNHPDGDTERMRFINFVCERYPKPRNTDKKDFKEKLENTLRLIFWEVGRSENICQLIERYGDEIAEKYNSLESFQGFLNWVRESTVNLEFTLGIEKGLTFSEIEEKANDTTYIDEGITKDMNDVFGEDAAKQLFEIYGSSKSQMRSNNNTSLLLKIGKLLNNTEKGLIIELCVDTYLETSVSLNHNQLSNLYRIIYLMIHEYQIHSNTEEIINCIFSGGLRGGHVTQNINNIYTSMVGVIRKDQITNHTKFFDTIISYLESGDKKILSDLQSGKIV